MSEPQQPLQEDDGEANNSLSRRNETERFLPAPADNLDNTASHDSTKEEIPPSNNYKDYKIWKRLQVDVPFRKRFLHSVFLCYVIVGTGWVTGQMGPSFPDLRNLVGKSVESGAWLFTISSFGIAVGSFVEGFLYGRISNLFALITGIAIISVSTGVLPWFTTFAGMLVARFANGFGGGAVEAIANADIAAIWDEEGRPYMQALHFSFGLGGILSPLATEPFLSEKSCIQPFIKNGTDTYSISTGTTTLTLLRNSTAAADCQWEYGETSVHYAFLIAAIIMMSSAVPFVAICFKDRGIPKSSAMKADKSNMVRPDTLPAVVKNVLLVLLCLNLFMYCAVEDTFNSFLMTFCIQYLDWTKENGSYATSLHWMAFAIGRFSGIFIVRWLSPDNMIFVFTSLLVSAFVGFLLVSLTMTKTAVWFFVPLVGFSMSVICPSIYSWTEEAIFELTGVISALFVISCSLGLVVNPLFLGYLMDRYDPIAFPYLLVSQSAICLILYLMCKCIVHKCVKPRKQREIEMDVIGETSSIQRSVEQ